MASCLEFCYPQETALRRPREQDGPVGCCAEARFSTVERAEGRYDTLVARILKAAPGLYPRRRATNGGNPKCWSTESYGKDGEKLICPQEHAKIPLASSTAALASSPPTLLHRMANPFHRESRAPHGSRSPCMAPRRPSHEPDCDCQFIRNMVPYAMQLTAS